MEETEDGFRLSTGREFYAHACIIGIGSDLRVSYGYDGGVEVWPRPWMADYSKDWGGFTKAERQELADHMIALWQKFREASAPIEES